MKKLVLSVLLLTAINTVANAQFKNVLNKAKDKITAATGKTGSLSTTDISKALKEALNKGVTEQVTKLTATDGFYKNEAVKYSCLPNCKR